MVRVPRPEIGGKFEKESGDTLAPLCIGKHMQQVGENPIAERSRQIGVVIPAINAAHTLRQVVKTSKQQLPDATIFLVDDGSIDETSDVGTRLRCRVLRHPDNRGKGAALRTGFAAALGAGCELIFTLDADGQHDSLQIPDFLTKLQKENLDIVIGNRMDRARNMPRDRYLSNRLSSLVVSRLCGSRIPDSQCGYRLIRAGVLRAVDLRTERFETESELLVRAARARFRIGSITIDATYSGTASSISRVGDTVRFLRLVSDLIVFGK